MTRLLPLLALLQVACSTVAVDMTYNFDTHEARCRVVASSWGQSSVTVDWSPVAAQPPGAQINIGVGIATGTTPVHCVENKGGPISIGASNALDTLATLGVAILKWWPW